MTDERKKLIHEFYTMLYRSHLEYSDIDNLSSDSEERWLRYISSVDDLIDKMEKKADELDLFIMRKQVSIQMATIEKLSIERAKKRQDEIRLQLNEKRRDKDHEC